jgi:hypothetical protein
MQTNRLNLRKVAAIAACLAVTVMFSGCKEEDSGDNPISKNDSYVLITENPLIVKVMNLENDKGDIAFAQFYVTYYSNGEWPYLEFSTEFKHGGFELIFPATIPDEYLQSASNGLLPVHIDAHNSDNANIGGFSFRSNNWAIEFKYADRDFDEKRISDYGVEFDCSYKKGWNVVYWSSDGGKKRTTQKPLNETFKCYFSYNTLLD